MTAGEKMLTLVLELFADDCALDTYTERNRNLVREALEKAIATGVWDVADRERLGDERNREWARHEKFQDEGFGELERLRAETSPDELTPEQHSEIRELLDTMRAMSQRRAEESKLAAEQAQRWLDGGSPPTVF